MSAYHPWLRLTLLATSVNQQHFSRLLTRTDCDPQRCDHTTYIQPAQQYFGHCIVVLTQQTHKQTVSGTFAKLQMQQYL